MKKMISFIFLIFLFFSNFAFAKKPSPYVQLINQIHTQTTTVWKTIFKQLGMTYTPPKLHIYSNSAKSSCGPIHSSAGPVYCPLDRTIYIDPEFFDFLANQLKAPGDAARAYVIAHEVAHHVQTLAGTTWATLLAKLIVPSKINQLSMRVELQADCFAGIWASEVNRRGIFSVKPSDLGSALLAAYVIGDDHLQIFMGVPVDTSKFAHGSSVQRVSALALGYLGDLKHCEDILWK